MMLRTIGVTLTAMLVSAAPSAQRAGQPSSASALEQQVRLDRAGFSPGEIDGKSGTNTARAQAAYDKAHGNGQASQNEAAIVDYTITPEDVAGQFTASIP